WDRGAAENAQAPRGRSLDAAGAQTKYSVACAPSLDLATMAKCATSRAPSAVVTNSGFAGPCAVAPFRRRHEPPTGKSAGVRAISRPADISEAVPPTRGGLNALWIMRGPLLTS